MQRSQELLDAYTQTLQRIQDGKIASINETLSTSDAVSIFGTEGTEWLGRDQFVPVLDAQWAVLRQLGARIESHAEAWADGDVGFVVDSATLSLTGGPSVPMRWTTVFHKEDGSWKGVHQHASFGVPTDDEAVRAFNDAVAGGMPQA